MRNPGLGPALSQLGLFPLSAEAELIVAWSDL